jgi:hypothetical protein
MSNNQRSWRKRFLQRNVAALFVLLTMASCGRTADNQQLVSVLKSNNASVGWLTSENKRALTILLRVVSDRDDLQRAFGDPVQLDKAIPWALHTSDHDALDLALHRRALEDLLDRVGIVSSDEMLPAALHIIRRSKATVDNAQRDALFVAALLFQKNEAIRKHFASKQLELSAYLAWAGTVQVAAREPWASPVDVGPLVPHRRALLALSESLDHQG